MPPLEDQDPQADETELAPDDRCGSAQSSKNSWQQTHDLSDSRMSRGLPLTAGLYILVSLAAFGILALTLGKHFWMLFQPGSRRVYDRRTSTHPPHVSLSKVFRAMRSEGHDIRNVFRVLFTPSVTPGCKRITWTCVS